MQISKYRLYISSFSLPTIELGEKNLDRIPIETKIRDRSESSQGYRKRIHRKERYLFVCSCSSSLVVNPSIWLWQFRVLFDEGDDELRDEAELDMLLWLQLARLWRHVRIWRPCLIGVRWLKTAWTRQPLLPLDITQPWGKSTSFSSRGSYSRLWRCDMLYVTMSKETRPVGRDALSIGATLLPATYCPVLPCRHRLVSRPYLSASPRRKFLISIIFPV